MVFFYYLLSLNVVDGKDIEFFFSISRGVLPALQLTSLYTLALQTTQETLAGTRMAVAHEDTGLFISTHESSCATFSSATFSSAAEYIQKPVLPIGDLL